MYAAEIGAAVIERSSTHPTPPPHTTLPPLYTPKKPIDQGFPSSPCMCGMYWLFTSPLICARVVLSGKVAEAVFLGLGNRCIYRGYRRRMGREGHPPSSNFPYARGRGGGHRKFNLDIFSGLLHPLSFIRMDTVSGKKFLAQNTQGFPESDPGGKLITILGSEIWKKKLL